MSGQHAIVQARQAAAVDRLRKIARIWDELVRLPVIGTRIGLDAVVGLIPGVGDVAGALVASWALVTAATLRVPASVMGQMLLNIGVDAMVGAIPILGDIFDIGWHAQRRNLILLENWTASSEQVRRKSSLTLLAVAGAMIVVVVGALWLSIAALSWLVARV